MTQVAQSYGKALYRGFMEWATNEDAIKYLDFDVHGANASDACNVLVRNESATVSLTAIVGERAQALPHNAILLNGVACTMANTGDIVTYAAHGLSVGDPVRFGSTTGGVTVATIYFVLTVLSADTFTLSTSKQGGSIQALNADGANTLYTVASQSILTGVVAEADDDTFTTLSPHGFQIGDAIQLSGITGGGTSVTAGTVYYVLTVPTVTTFTIATARAGSTLNVTPDITACTIVPAEEFYETARFSVPVFAAATSTAPVAGLESQPVGNLTGKSRIYLAKSASTAAAFKAYIEVRRS